MTNINESSETILQSYDPEVTSLDEHTRVTDLGKLKAAEENVTAEWNVGDIILNLYEVTDVLGKGGMGKVYKVHHKNWKMDLTVKSPLPDIVATKTGKENFIREAETWVNLGLHPHIVSCYYVRTLGNIPRVFAEYVEGGSLKDWIGNGKLYEGGQEKAMERILDIAIQFVWGLDYAHEQGLIHQDIKPANVLLTNDGIAKVTDFGLAKARSISGEKYVPGSGESVLVSKGGMTPAYCSPEQAEGQPLSRKTDIWSCGLSILEMFTGGVNWMSGIVASGALESYLNEGSENPDIPKMPDSLVELLRKCFLKDTQNRLADISEIVGMMKVIYKEVTQKEYSRKEPKSLDLRADGLNNKAISLLDLGKEEAAVRSWREALKVDPQHLYSNFNYGYYRWQKAEIIPEDLLLQMQQIENVYKANPEYWLLLGWVHYERGDAEEIEKIQKSEFKINDDGFLTSFEDKDKPVVKFLSSLTGHYDTVETVCFSPDGQYALSGSQDSSIILWDLSSKREVRRFICDGQYITSVCFSPDGLNFLSANRDGTIRFWDMETEKEVKQFKVDKYSVRSVCFSKNGLYLISGGDDMIIKLLEVSSGRSLKQYEGHTGTIKSICFSPDEHFILSGSSDGTIRLWDISSGKEIKKFERHTQDVESVCFSPDGKCILSGGFDGKIILWETMSGKILKEIQGHDNGVISLSFSPFGFYALSCGSELTQLPDSYICPIKLWDVKSGREIRRLEKHQATVNSIAFSSDGRYALSGSCDKIINLWEVYYHEKEWRGKHPYPSLCKIKTITILGSEQNKFKNILESAKKFLKNNSFQETYNLLRESQSIPGYQRDREVFDMLTQCGLKGNGKRINLKETWLLGTFKEHTDRINSICFSPNSHYILSGSNDATIRLLAVSNGKEINRFESNTGAIYSVAFSPDGSFIAAGSFRKIQFWELLSGKKIKEFEGHSSFVFSLCFFPDSRYLLSGSDDKTIKLWEVSSGKEIMQFKGHTKSVRSVCLSSDGRFILSHSEDRTIRLWETSSGKELICYDGYNEYDIPVCFSPDGNFTLSSGIGNTIVMWEILSGKEITKFKGHFITVNCADFSPDGRYILSGSWDKTVRLWKVSNSSEIKQFKTHTEVITKVCFSPSGQYFASCSDDKTIQLWEFDWEWEFSEEEKQSFNEKG